MTEQRNYGIDLLRMVSMYLVVVLHILGIGGVITGSELLSANFHAAWLIRVAFLCAVNCYALISGFVGFRSRHRAAGLIQLWLQAAVYSVGIAFLCRRLWPEGVTDKVLIGSFLPVTTGQYWYFTAYFGMFFLKPLLNFAAEHMPEKQLRLTLAGILFVFSVLPISPLTDAFYLHDGYSVLWLCVVYLLGAYLGKYGVLERLSPGRWALVYVGAVLFAYVPRMVALWLKPELWTMYYGNLAIEYTSPTIVLAAVAVVGIFSRLRIPKGLQKPVRWLAQLSFGVYLIHSHPLIFQFWLTDRYAALGTRSAGEMIVTVLASALGIYALCSAIDAVRLGLFRLLRIRQLAGWMDRKIAGLVK